jgi:hypothetical protein
MVPSSMFITGELPGAAVEARRSGWQHLSDIARGYRTARIAGLRGTVLPQSAEIVARTHIDVAGSLSEGRNVALVAATHRGDRIVAMIPHHVLGDLVAHLRSR